MSTSLTADLALVGGTLLTMRDREPRAGALAVLGDRIVAVEADGDDLPPATRTVDLRGRCVVPGFHDAHNHMAWFGQTLRELDLGTPPLHSLDELYAAVGAAAAELPADAWVVGNGYDENKLGGHPHRDVLDRVADGRPMLALHTSGHMCAVSSAVLRELGLDRHGRDVDGGRVVCDADGRPTGLLQERAQELVNPLRRPVALRELTDAVEAAGARYLSEGLTSVVEAGIGGGWIGRSPLELAAYQQARAQGRLPVRVELMVVSDMLHALHGHEDDAVTRGLDLGMTSGFGDDRLSLGPVKVFADGSLIGRTAAMTEDYADTPGNRGYLQADHDELVDRIVAAHCSGWRVAVHAIGDAAIDLVLDAVEDAQRRRPRPDVRHRIEHFGVSRPDQVTRAATLGVVPVPQGRFVGEIGDGMLAALGERAGSAYRLRSLLAAGLVLPGSSDRPVVDGRPMLGIHDMVNRRTANGAPFGPGEALTVEQALRAYTQGSAAASRQETERGTLRVGMLADLAVLDRDPTAVPVEELAQVAVEATVLGGDVVHDPTGALA